MNLPIESQIILITGATSGIGKYTSLILAQMGATVVATARNEEKAMQLVRDFKSAFPDSKGKIEILPCNLARFLSVVEAVKTFKRKYQRIDILINNAGVFNLKRRLTEDGIEETFQVNVLSPLLLTLLFEQMIIESKGRIINTSSSFHHGTINFNDLEGRHYYSGLNAYRQSKLAEILITRRINTRLKNNGAYIFCQHPGIVRTNLGKSNSLFLNLGLRIIGKSVKRGAETLIYLSTSTPDQLVSGGYYANKRLWKSKPHSNDMDLADELIHSALLYLEPYINQYKFNN